MSKVRNLLRTRGPKLLTVIITDTFQKDGTSLENIEKEEGGLFCSPGTGFPSYPVTTRRGLLRVVVDSGTLYEPSRHSRLKRIINSRTKTLSYRGTAYLIRRGSHQGGESTGVSKRVGDEGRGSVWKERTGTNPVLLYRCIHLHFIGDNISAR